MRRNQSISTRKQAKQKAVEVHRDAVYPRALIIHPSSHPSLPIAVAFSIRHFPGASHPSVRAPKEESLDRSWGTSVENVHPISLDLASAAVLAIGATDLLGASSLLAGLARNGTDDLVSDTLDFVAEVRLALVVGSGRAALGHTGSLGGSGSLATGGSGFALALRVSGNGRMDARLGVARRCARGSHG